MQTNLNENEKDRVLEALYAGNNVEFIKGTLTSNFETKSGEFMFENNRYLVEEYYEYVICLKRF